MYKLVLITPDEYESLRLAGAWVKWWTVDPDEGMSQSLVRGSSDKFEVERAVGGGAKYFFTRIEQEQS